MVTDYSGSYTNVGTIRLPSGQTRATKLVICPCCRGYNIERQWCSVCKGSGVIEVTGSA